MPLLWFLAVFLLASPALAEPGRLHRYEIAIDPELSTLSVRACFGGAPPEALVAESLDAPLALIDARIESSGKPLVPSGAMSLKNVPVDGCISYRVDVSRPIRRHDRTGDKVVRVGGAVLAAAGIWLWRPERLDPDEDIELIFKLPPGISVSAPWEPLGDSASPVFRLGVSPYDWPATVAFGRFEPRWIEAGGSRLEVIVLDGTPPVDAGAMRDWLAEAAVAVTDLYGRFPVPRAQLLVVPNARGPEPTPSAYVVRGGGPAVHFFVNQRRPIEEFLDDWTATHELAHLFLPFIRHEDAWLSEGLATYYQNVLRARAGRMSPEQAWERLHAGFQRGRDNARGMTLAQATEHMYRADTYMRVYWEGAAMILLADVALRQASGGGLSMDSALAGLAECCLRMERAWSAQELFAKLDELTGSTVFSSLLSEYVGSSEFPDLSGVYQALGLRFVGSELQYAGSQSEQALRDSIMQAKSRVVMDASL
jgi:hypothetical protein